jgi:hypothetical protein
VLLDPHTKRFHLSQSTVQNVSNLEMQGEENRKIFDDMDVEIKRKLDGGMHVTKALSNMLCLEDKPEDKPECFYDKGFIPNVDDVDGYNEYIGAKLMFDFLGDDIARGQVIKGEDGQPIGKRNINPILDSRMYTVHLSDGSHHKLSANIIAENLYAQVNEQGHQQLIFWEIIGHQTNSEYTNDIPIKTVSYFHIPKTTKVWEIQVVFRDKSTAWLPMNEVRMSNPIELAEYARMSHIAEEPEFAWWVQHALCTCQRMISKIKSTYWCTTHKSGIELPKNVNDAYEINKKMGPIFAAGHRKGNEKDS